MREKGQLLNWWLTYITCKLGGHTDNDSSSPCFESGCLWLMSDCETPYTAPYELVSCKTATDTTACFESLSCILFGQSPSCILFGEVCCPAYYVPISSRWTRQACRLAKVSDPCVKVLSPYYVMMLRPLASCHLSEASWCQLYVAAAVDNKHC
jgi:hypothetical protein